METKQRKTKRRGASITYASHYEQETDLESSGLWVVTIKKTAGFEKLLEELRCEGTQENTDPAGKVFTRPLYKTYFMRELGDFNTTPRAFVLALLQAQREITVNFCSYRDYKVCMSVFPDFSRILGQALSIKDSEITEGRISFTPTEVNKE